MLLLAYHFNHLSKTLLPDCLHHFVFFYHFTFSQVFQQFIHYFELTYYYIIIYLDIGQLVSRISHIVH